VSDLLDRLDDPGLWRLAQELLELGVARMMKVAAVGRSDAGIGEEEGGGDREPKPEAEPALPTPRPAQDGVPPWCFTGPPPPGAAGSVPPPEGLPSTDEGGPVPPERLMQMLGVIYQRALYLSDFVSRHGAEAAAAEQQQMQQRAQCAMPPGPPWNSMPPLQGMPLPLPPGLPMVPHVLDDTRSTQCRPLLADESVERLSTDEPEAAQKQAQEAANVENLASEVPCTTFIVKNLPASLSDQEVAREWLDTQGFRGEYDFFMWFRGTTKREALGVGGSAKQPQRRGYLLVNFRDVAAGQRCKDGLDGQQVDDSGARLGVVAARKQGLDNLRLHFEGVSLPVR